MANAEPLPDASPPPSPAVRPPRRDSLQRRLIAYVGFGLLLFALVLGGVIYRWVFQHELEDAAAVERQLVAAVKAQAEVAVFARNQQIAEGVLDGLTSNPRIAHVRIVGDLQPVSDWAHGTMPAGAAPVEEYPLLSPVDGTTRIGVLQVARHADAIKRDAVNQALKQVGLLFTLLAMTLALLVLLVRFWLGRPLARLTDQLAAISPGAAARVKAPAGHADDELGSLADSANVLLDATEQAMRELNEANARLAKALAQLTDREQRRSRYFAAANHDLRQPVHAINLFLDGLERAALPAPHSRLVRSMRTATTTLGELLESLLDIAKLDAGAVVPQPEWIELDALVARIDNNFSALALQKHLHFRLWYPTEEMWVHSDRRLLNAMIDNLVGNALKCTVRGGILVAFRRSGHGGLVQVWDTGPGIAEEHIEKIFDEFYQVTEGTRDRPKGLGLGLAIVRRTAELLGCQVACRSRPGRGTVFEISLPPGSVRAIDYGEQTPWRMMSTDRPRAVVLAGRRFVVVEDDRLVAEALAAWLSGHQAVVSVFATAEAALASPAADVADCFVVDHQLAGALSGVDFLSAMHTRRGGQFRAVLVTGNTDGAQADLVGRGPWPLLFKPTSPTDILAALSAQTLTQEVAAPSDRDVPAGAP